MISSTIATYIFVNKNNTQLLFSNICGAVTSMLIAALLYTVQNDFNVDIMIFSILTYRIAELLYLIRSSQNPSIRNIQNITKKDFSDTAPFYFQLLLSIGSAKLFMLFLPVLLSYEDISIIGTYGYIVAIPLFFISVPTMTTYTKLLKIELDKHFDEIKYNSLMQHYYQKALFISITLIILQFSFLKLLNNNLMDYFPYLLVHDITIIFTAIQGYILFFWRMNKLIINISIFTLVVKNLLMFYFINVYGLEGFFIVTIFFEIFILLLIKSIVNNKIHSLRHKNG